MYFSLFFFFSFFSEATLHLVTDHIIIKLVLKWMLLSCLLVFIVPEVAMQIVEEKKISKMHTQMSTLTATTITGVARYAIGE